MPLQSFRLRKSDSLIAVVLFSSFWFVYSISIPSSFNTRYENRRFFDSDGEFITRQFFLGETHTHNDHLLYHVIARGLYDMTADPPAQAYDSVPQHRWLSITAGALGVSILFLFGKQICGSTGGALAASLLIGGCAGWWFFTATIDTYLPHLTAAIASLGYALLALQHQKLRHYTLLGVFIGLAFLFRTDGFLLALLGVVAFAGNWKVAGQRLALCAATAAIVGLIGYAVLAHAYYGVPLAEVPDWALSHANRPGIKKHQWGNTVNINQENLVLALANQSVYTVILPGLEMTRESQVINLFQRNGHSMAVFFLYLAVIIAAAIRLVWRRRWWWLGLILLWFLPRTLLFTWWDPSEPFLFACLSLPSLWILLLDFVSEEPNTSHSTAVMRNLRTVLVIFLAAGIWWHNYHTMIRPLRALEKMVIQRS
jgi:Dolichyl-phosphate-mannose-protein mannosyltransferase